MAIYFPILSPWPFVDDVHSTTKYCSFLPSFYHPTTIYWVRGFCFHSRLAPPHPFIGARPAPRAPALATGISKALTPAIERGDRLSRPRECPGARAAHLKSGPSALRHPAPNRFGCISQQKYPKSTPDTHPKAHKQTQNSHSGVLFQ